MEAVFGRFEADNLPYLVLRNYETLPESTTNDVDLLLSPDDELKAYHSLVCAAEEAGWEVCNVGEFSCRSVFLYNPETLEQTHIDLMCGIKWYSFLFADHAQMLRDRKRCKSFYIPAQKDEAAVNLLTRLLYCGYVKEKYRPMISACAKESHDAFAKVLEPWIGSVLAELFVKYSCEENWTKIEKMTADARKHVLIANLKKPGGVLFRMFADVRRLIRRICIPPGFSIAFIGDDAIGMQRHIKDFLKLASGTFKKEKVQMNAGNRTILSKFKSMKTLFRNGLVIQEQTRDENRLSRNEYDLIISFQTSCELNARNVIVADASFTPQKTLLTMFERMSERRMARYG